MPFADVLLEKQQEAKERNTAAETLTNSAIWWQQTRTRCNAAYAGQTVKPHHEKRHPGDADKNVTAVTVTKKEMRGRMRLALGASLPPSRLPQGRTRTSDCPSCGDT